MATKKTAKKTEEVKKTAAKAVEPAKVETKVEKKVEKAAVKAPKTEKKAEKAPKAEKKAAKETKKTVKKAAEKALLAASVKGLFFEYGDKQVDAASLAEIAKDAYKANGGTATVKTLQLYVKAEDNALYYVVNGKESGKADL